MISAFANIWRVPELRDRILFTLAMIIIVRLGVAITSCQEIRPSWRVGDPRRSITPTPASLNRASTSTSSPS